MHIQIDKYNNTHPSCRITKMQKRLLVYPEIVEYNIVISGLSTGNCLFMNEIGIVCALCTMRYAYEYEICNIKMNSFE